MKRLFAILGSLAFLALGQAGCGSAIEVWPHAAVNQEVGAMIESSGGDPADWAFDNNCANMGNCNATLATANAPGRVLATNVYVVKDSRATLTGTDRIAEVIDRAAADSCFENFSTAGPLIRCVRGSA